MKKIGKITALFILILLNACSKDNPVTKSNEASLLKLELENGGTTYQTTINGTNVSISGVLPFLTEKVTIKNIEVSPKATVSRQSGDVLPVKDGPIPIEVTAENNQIKQIYSLILKVAEEPDYAKLLFEQYTAMDCKAYAKIAIDELKVENNVWNTDGLPPNSFTQCIYVYDAEALKLLGWQWQYPANAYGVNAYPELIFGWKPWQPSSTTLKLPKKISDISKLKVDYDVEVTRNDGDYNLAFDNWINSAANITPQNILFEFMIWEDANNLVPFGDFQEDVSTTNDTYKFYMGDPDWEPPGSNWTYIAFQRIDYRSKGTVDIDELLDYLVGKGIVSQDSYLASVELGNEVGNSTGQAIVKKFSVEIE